VLDASLPVGPTVPAKATQLPADPAAVSPLGAAK